jgi:hypothetical protein
MENSIGRLKRGTMIISTVVYSPIETNKNRFENTSIFSELKKIENLDKYVYDSVGKRAANYGSSS